MVFHRASVQSPTTRMWTLTKGSPGALVMVNGCHSVEAILGTLTNVYWPGLREAAALAQYAHRSRLWRPAMLSWLCRKAAGDGLPS